MRSAAACLAGVFVFLAAAVASADVDDYLGKSVASIRLTSEGHDTNDPRLLQILETRVGRPLTMVDVRETMVHLFSLGRFEDVRVHADVTPGGVALIYELIPAYPVERVQFVGSLEAPGVDEGRLRRAMVDRYGPSPPAARAPDVARLLEAQLGDRGYLHASVTPRVELEHTPDRAVLAFRIDARSPDAGRHHPPRRVAGNTRKGPPGSARPLRPARRTSARRWARASPSTSRIAGGTGTSKPASPRRSSLRTRTGWRI